MIIDGCILLFPIDRQPELLPQLLKSLFVDLRELPQSSIKLGRLIISGGSFGLLRGLKFGR